MPAAVPPGHPAPASSPPPHPYGSPHLPRRRLPLPYDAPHLPYHPLPHPYDARHRPCHRPRRCRTAVAFTRRRHRPLPTGSGRPAVRAAQPPAEVLVRYEGERQVPVARQPRVQVDHAGPQSGAPVGGGEHRVDAVPVPDEDQLGVRPPSVHHPVDHPQHVPYVRLQIGVRCPGERHGMRLGARVPQPCGHVPPDPSAGEQLRHQHECDHEPSLTQASAGRPVR